MSKVLRRAIDELRQMIVGGLAALLGLALVVLTVVSAVLSLVGGLGIPLLMTVVRWTRQLADRHRRWAGSVLGRPVESPYAVLPTGRFARLRAVAREKATWRDLAWLLLNSLVSGVAMAVALGLWAGALQALFAPLWRALLPADVVFDPLGFEVTSQARAWLLVVISPLVLVLAYVVPRYLIQARAWSVRWLLAPTTADRLGARVGRLAVTRSEATDSSASELRRIERNLHDGPQTRLVSLAMNLGMAEDVVDTDPATAKTMLSEARSNASTALAELRDLVRGVHPPVLADRGLAGALQALALTSSIPVELDLRLDRRLSAPIESAVYFSVAEALANSMRHSGASVVRIRMEDTGGALGVTVTDDGHGGADPAKGSGILGIQRRMAAFDGVVTVTSPAGGPTAVHVEVPCAS